MMGKSLLLVLDQPLDFGVQLFVLFVMETYMIQSVKIGSEEIFLGEFYRNVVDEPLVLMSMVAIDTLAVELYASMTIQPVKRDMNNLWPLHRMEPSVLHVSIQSIESPYVILQSISLYQAVEQLLAVHLYHRTSLFSLLDLQLNHLINTNKNIKTITRKN